MKKYQGVKPDKRPHGLQMKRKILQKNTWDIPKLLDTSSAEEPPSISKPFDQTQLRGPYRGMHQACRGYSSSQHQPGIPRVLHIIVVVNWRIPKRNGRLTDKAGTVALRKDPPTSGRLDTF